MRLIRFIDKFFVLFPLLLTFTSSIPDKVCKGGILDSSNIDSCKNCTKIDGHLIIRNETFTGGKAIPKMDPSELEVFSTVKEITGTLYVTATHPYFTDLHYFRNLQIIGEKWFLAAVHIKWTSLKSLGLRSLKRISGVISINANHNLCFAEGINWSKLQWRGSGSYGSPIYSNIQTENNRPKDACLADNMVCNKECLEDDGCWGPGVDECLSCKRFSLEGTCLDSCSYPGIYQSGELTCGKCHQECDGNCSGPGPGNCIKCPSMTYEMNGECVQCNEKCVDGCTGPGDFLGSGGCDKVMVTNNNPNQDDARGRSRKTDEPCKEGSFSELVSVTGTAKSWKLICRPCHPNCKNCTGYGSHLSVCNECARFRSEERCEDQCPIEYYADYATMRCMLCSSDCKGCTGLGSDQCDSCRYLKVPLGDNITHEFYCSDKCPEDKPLVRLDKGGPYCSVKDPVEEEHRISVSAVSGVVVACIFLIGVYAAAYRYRCWQRRTCLRENTVKMTMFLQGVAGLEESDPLKSSDVDSNDARLRKFKDEQVDKADGTIVNLEEPVDEQGNSGGSRHVWSQFTQELTLQDMWTISQFLDNKNWNKVGRNLKVDNNRLDEIESKSKNSEWNRLLNRLKGISANASVRVDHQFVQNSDMMNW